MRRHRVNFLMFFYTFAKDKDDHNLHNTIRLPDKRNIRVSSPQQLSLMPALLSAITFKQLL